MNDKDEAILGEVLRSAFDQQVEEMAAADVVVPAPPRTPEEPKKSPSDNYTQWAIAGNGKYIPIGATTATVPPGVYEGFAEPGAWGWERITISSDGIYLLPDMATETVLK